MLAKRKRIIQRRLLWLLSRGKCPLSRQRRVHPIRTHGRMNLRDKRNVDDGIRERDRNREGMRERERERERER